MEFRLSEKTVSNYTEYTTERARYAGSNGASGGNWKDLKTWCVDNGFTCTWRDYAVPKKAGETSLGKALENWFLANQTGMDAQSFQVLGGIMGSKGKDNTTHTNDDGDGTVQWGLWYTNKRLNFADYVHWSLGQVFSILLVRPL